MDRNGVGAMVLVVVESVLDFNPVVSLRACSWSNDFALGIHAVAMVDSVNKCCRDSTHEKKRD